jgi:hypothetical protein
VDVYASALWPKPRRGMMRFSMTATKPSGSILKRGAQPPRVTQPAALLLLSRSRTRRSFQTRIAGLFNPHAGGDDRQERFEQGWIGLVAHTGGDLFAKGRPKSL